jgi:hypothetical protein
MSGNKLLPLAHIQTCCRGGVLDVMLLWSLVVHLASTPPSRFCIGSAREQKCYRSKRVSSHVVKQTEAHLINGQIICEHILRRVKATVRFSYNEPFKSVSCVRFQRELQAQAMVQCNKF